MPPARITANDANGTSTSASVSATYPQATVAGRFLAAWVWSNVGTGKNTLAGWNLKQDTACGSGGNLASISLYWKIADGTEHVVTATDSGGTATLMRINIREYSGIDASPVDISNGRASIAAATSSQSNALTTTNANDLLLCGWGFGGGSISVGATPFDSSFDLIAGTNNRMIDGERVVSATGTFQPTATWTTSRTSGVIVAAFKAASTQLASGTAKLDGFPSVTAQGQKSASGSVVISALASLTGATDILSKSGTVRIAVWPSLETVTIANRLGSVKVAGFPSAMFPPHVAGGVTVRRWLSALGTVYTMAGFAAPSSVWVTEGGEEESVPHPAGQAWFSTRTSLRFQGFAERIGPVTFAVVGVLGIDGLVTPQIIVLGGSIRDRRWAGHARS